MNLTSSKNLLLLTAAYFLSGLLLGLADPPLGRVSQSLGTKPGVATAVTVNFLLPLVALGLGAFYPRLAGAWVGAIVMTVGLIEGLAIQYPPANAASMSMLDMLKAIPPMLLVAAVGYGVLGTVAALATRSWRATA